jgi:hypothetical protein
VPRDLLLGSCRSRDSPARVGENSSKLDEYDRLHREWVRESRTVVKEENGQALRWCKTPNCPRLTTAEHCCGACATAREGRYEIHESGPLAHSEACDERHRRRSEA